MPILEFYSPDTHKIYTFLARNSEQAQKVPKCPDGLEYKMEKMVSTFAVLKRSETDDASDEPGLEAAMGEVEQLIGGIDENNPDPKKLGYALRKMSEISGQPLGGNMEEMVRKLEEGVA